MTHWVAGPLMTRGLIPLPKNLPLPKPVSPDESYGGEDGDIESLHALLMDYLSRVETGNLDPPVHPALGDLGVDGWARLHVVHFEHHCKQFGV